MAKTFAKKYTKEIARYQKTHPEYKQVKVKDAKSKTGFRIREIGMTDEQLREALNYRQYKIYTTGRAPKKTEKELLRALRKDPYARIGMTASSYIKDIGTLKSKIVQMSLAKDFLSIGEKKEKVYESVTNFVSEFEKAGFRKYEAIEMYQEGVKKYGANFIKAAAYQPAYAANWVKDLNNAQKYEESLSDYDPRMQEIMRLWRAELDNKRKAEDEYRRIKEEAEKLCKLFPNESAQQIFERLIGGDAERRFEQEYDDPLDMPF